MGRHSAGAVVRQLMVVTHLSHDGGMSGDGTFIKDGSNSELIVRNFSGASIANMEVHQGTLTGAGSNGALGGATTTNYLGEDGGANNATMKWIGGINGTVTERAGIIVQAGTGTKTYAKGNSNDITDNTDITLNGDLTVKLHHWHLHPRWRHQWQRWAHQDQHGNPRAHW